jgi:hypothetical protein
MERKPRLQRIEERFWKGDADYYRQHLAEDALLVFAEPVGVLDKDASVQTMSQSPRWKEVTLEAVRILELSASAVLLSYRATAVREGAETPYVTLASSVYVERGGAWLLVFHQQTPAPGAYSGLRLP